MNKQRSRAVSSSAVIAMILLVSIGLGCRMLGGTDRANKDNRSGTEKKGLAPAAACALINDPVFEERKKYMQQASGEGYDCSGATHFGLKNPNGPQSLNDPRPGYSYYVLGNKDVAENVFLSMSGRNDSAAQNLFVVQANAVAMMINQQPLPSEIESAITGSYLGASTTREWTIGAAKVELFRASAGDVMSLKFKF